MKTANIRDLRNRFPRVAAWIEQGEPVEITRNGKVFARLVPAVPETPRRFRMPDIMARLRANFGDEVYSAEELQGVIQESRGERS
ncbi:MAG: prevent-host-death protein [Verrucomicrobiota bacterium]|jgi:antitoxin (DNA-binding transcriptional repressor) of toxin-antitoxin stability system